MLPRFVVVTGLALALTGRAQAQAGPGQYAAERDSLWQRAARVRVRTEARARSFTASFKSVGGTRRRVDSYGRLRVKDAKTSLTPRVLVKSHVTKHKTSVVEVEKILYYGLDGRRLLAEYYQQHQLVRLELSEYPLREGGEYGKAFRTSEWVRGDYLHVTTRTPAGRQQQYYSAPRLPE